MMFERLSSTHYCRSIAHIASLALLVIAPLCHAEIYKWVDANGKTHYSAKRDIAGKAKVEEIKLRIAPTSAETINPSAKKWQEQEDQFKQRQLQREIEERERKIAAAPSNSRRDDYSATCNLAKGILTGDKVRADGKPISADEWDTAKANIRSYCR